MHEIEVDRHSLDIHIKMLFFVQLRFNFLTRTIKYTINISIAITKSKLWLSMNLFKFQYYQFLIRNRQYLHLKEIEN